jgi:hypothetical protein
LVDLSEIQAAYYMVAATGVLVAAVFYILNLRVQQENMRETTKNRKASFTTDLMSNFTTKEGIRDWYELMSMQWVDFDDFSRKYDSRVNPENYIKREHFWSYCDSIGWQLRTGVIDWDTVRKTGRAARSMWLKFKPIIEEYRKREYGLDAFEDFEYLALRMDEVTSLEDKRRRQFMLDGFRHEDVKSI